MLGTLLSNGSEETIQTVPYRSISYLYILECVGLLKWSFHLADGGHDSLEDARACMELMLWKAKIDLQKTTRRVSDS